VPLGLNGAQLHNLMVDRIQDLLVKDRPGKLLVVGYPLFVFDALIAHGNSAISFFSQDDDGEAGILFRSNRQNFVRRQESLAV
jgi:hypothetical protein